MAIQDVVVIAFGMKPVIPPAYGKNSKSKLFININKFEGTN